MHVTDVIKYPNVYKDISAALYQYLLVHKEVIYLHNHLLSTAYLSANKEFDHVMFCVAELSKFC